MCVGGPASAHKYMTHEYCFSAEALLSQLNLTTLQDSPTYLYTVICSFHKLS